MIDLDFIKRCEEFAKPFSDEIHKKSLQKITKWNHDNPEKLKACRKAYENSEKGKEKRKMINAVRSRRIRHHVNDLSILELNKIKEFYVNCPPGYEVDHIIPISKGGKHNLINLQYLTKYDNLVKGSKTHVLNACEYEDDLAILIKKIPPKWKIEEDRRNRLLAESEALIKQTEEFMNQNMIK